MHCTGLCSSLAPERGDAATMLSSELQPSECTVFKTDNQTISRRVGVRGPNLKMMATFR